MRSSNKTGKFENCYRRLGMINLQNICFSVSKLKQTRQKIMIFCKTAKLKDVDKFLRKCDGAESLLEFCSH